MPSGSSTQPANQSPDVPATASLNTDEPLPQPRHRAPRSLTLHPNQGVWRVHSVSRVWFPFPLKCHSGVIMPAVNCAHSTRKAALHLSGLTQKPGAGLGHPNSSPGDDSAAWARSLRCCQDGPERQGHRPGAWPAGHRPRAFLQDCSCSKRSLDPAKSKRPGEQSTGESMWSCAFVKLPPLPGSTKSSPEIPHPALEG